MEIGGKINHISSLTRGQPMNNRSVLILRESPSRITGRPFLLLLLLLLLLEYSICYALICTPVTATPFRGGKTPRSPPLPPSPGDLCDSVWRLELRFDQSFPKTRRPVGNSTGFITEGCVTFGKTVPSNTLSLPHSPRTGGGALMGPRDQ